MSQESPPEPEPSQAAPTAPPTEPPVQPPVQPQPQPQTSIDPARLTQLALGYWPARVFLAAVELDLFNELGTKTLSRGDLCKRLGLQARAAGDFLEALVTLHVLQREGTGAEARYRNVAVGDSPLTTSDEPTRSWLAGLTDTARYQRWGTLTEALRQGSGADGGLFEDLYADPERLERFLKALAPVSGPGFAALAETLDLTGAATVLDVGGGRAELAVTLAQKHPHLWVTTFDRPEVAPIAERTVAAADVGGRIRVASGDFFTDPLPAADVVVLSLVLLDWDEDRKRHLLRAAQDALPATGRLVVIDRLEDDDPGARSTFELLRSLDLFLEHGDAHPFDADQLRGWCQEAGFSEVDIRPLVGPLTVAVARR